MQNVGVVVVARERERERVERPAYEIFSFFVFQLFAYPSEPLKTATFSAAFYLWLYILVFFLNKFSKKKKTHTQTTHLQKHLVETLHFSLQRGVHGRGQYVGLTEKDP